MSSNSQSATRRLIAILVLAGVIILSWLAAVALARRAAPTAEIVYVRTDGHDTSCNGGYNAPAANAPNCAFATIQKGVAEVDSGGVVNVAAGTYTENIAITQSLTLQGAGTNDTIVDGGSAGRVFAIDNLLTVGIYSLTLQHGYVVTGDSGGGGIRNWGSTLTLANVVVQNNNVDGSNNLDCGGGIHNLGELSLDNVIVSGNSASRGGGIRSNKALTITNSAFISNTVSVVGGGILVYGTATFENVTFSDNTAGSGDAIRNNGNITLSHCTIADNIYNTFGSVITFTNTIVTDTCSGTGATTSHGHNLDSGATCEFTATGDLTNTNPLLGPLTYESATWVHPLLPDSPAIDAGVCLAGITTDQRGVPRPQGTGCDIGAYEQSERKIYLPLVLRNH